jgi:hypothetical protein
MKMPLACVERRENGCHALCVTIWLPRHDHGDRALSYGGFHGFRSWPVRVTGRRRLADHPLRYHGRVAFGGGGQLGTTGAMPHLLTRQFSRTWSVLAPTPGPTLHGPVGQPERTAPHHPSLFALCGFIHWMSLQKRSYSSCDSVTGVMNHSGVFPPPRSCTN